MASELVWRGIDGRIVGEFGIKSLLVAAGRPKPSLPPRMVLLEDEPIKLRYSLLTHANFVERRMMGAEDFPSPTILWCLMWKNNESVFKCVAFEIQRTI